MSAQPKTGTTESGERCHYSAGAIIVDRATGKILLIDRMKTPFGWACPAGHVDEGEEPSVSVAREVEEETGLKVTSCTRLECDMVGFPHETCSRGVLHHVWTVYECTVTGEPKHNTDEVKGIGWFTPEEAKALPLEKAWRYFLTRLGYID